jgi:hypothetical protein
MKFRIMAVSEEEKEYEVDSILAPNEKDANWTVKKGIRSGDYPEGSQAILVPDPS